MTAPISTTLHRQLESIFDRLAAYYGPQEWWPDPNPFEVVAGALLVQNTAWVNAQTALDNLAAARALSIPSILELGEETLQGLIRPSGYFRQKASKLRAFAEHVQSQYGGDLAEMLGRPLDELRPELIAIWGVGAETADTILLYAARRPAYVVDRYTTRILTRLAASPVGLSHDELRSWLMQAIPPDADKYAEQHALLVVHGKTLCRKTPNCPECPLVSICRYGSGVVVQ